MKKIFLDTNIVIDILTNRAPFALDATKIFSLSENNELVLVVSPLTFATTNYMISNQLTEKEARKAVRGFRRLVEISNMNDKVVDFALNDDGFSDFEDGLQHYSALDSRCEIIITRDKKDFKNSKLPVMNPNQFLAYNKE